MNIKEKTHKVQLIKYMALQLYLICWVDKTCLVSRDNAHTHTPTLLPATQKNRERLMGWKNIITQLKKNNKIYRKVAFTIKSHDPGKWKWPIWVNHMNHNQKRPRVSVSYYSYEVVSLQGVAGQLDVAIQSQLNNEGCMYRKDEIACNGRI